jgi:hypothetical protein
MTSDAHEHEPRETERIGKAAGRFLTPAGVLSQAAGGAAWMF